MLGCNLVITWLTTFFAVSYGLCQWLGLKTNLLWTIFIWTLAMVFVAIFEMMLLFYYDYLENKGKMYYKEKLCYWLENNSIWDIFSYKMYMDLYADYSLSDKRYCENVEKVEGSRFVLTGEVIHGIFCIIMAPIILYWFFNYNEVNIYLSSIVFVSIQFALIVWYLVSVFVEMKFVKNKDFWAPPLLWNVPWVIIPPYVVYYAVEEILSKIGPISAVVEATAAAASAAAASAAAASAATVNSMPILNPVLAEATFSAT